MSQRDRRRTAGILTPLFSLRSHRGWGIGETGDVVPFSAWLKLCGQGLLQLLPVNEVAPSESSPYSSMSAFALDPIYITLDEVEDFHALGGEASLDPAARSALDRVRSEARVDHNAVRSLKQRALRACFDHFAAHELGKGTARDREFTGFAREQSDWLDDYALFRSLHDRHERHWEEWPAPLRERQPAALEEARHALAASIRYFKYLQWQAGRQWEAARRGAAANGILLKGDLPFMVSGHSADVWSNQHQFRLDASVGAPPDAFTADGQNWGLPPYDWNAMATDDFAWLRKRAQRAAQLYDFYRVDHVVGFYRTYTIPRNGGRPHFNPAEEDQQRALGERLMNVFRSAGAGVAAEDLGTIPKFVRRSLAGLSIPGYCVLRWEREWDEYGQPFRDPAAYPAVSVAVSGTHDTETIAEWWEKMPTDERRAACRIPALRQLNPDTATAFTPAVHRALLDALYGSGSQCVVLPIQDAFGIRERINIPATVGPHNWTWRFPWAISQLSTDAHAIEAEGRLAGCAARSDRLP